MPETVQMSWNHRHRLGQTRSDAEEGFFNAHHSVLAFLAVGDLDLAALDRAWTRLQLRHPGILSSLHLDSLSWRLGVREPAGLIKLEPDGGRSPDVATARDRARETVRRSAFEPFDIEHGPLGKMLVVPVADNETMVAVIVEHLVNDGWSRGLLLRDLAVLYDHEVGVGDGVLPAVERDFVEFTARQNAYVESPAGLRARRAAAARLAGVGAIPDVPIRGFTGQHPMRHDRIAKLSRRLDVEAYDRLLPVAKAARMTRLNLVLAALHAGLHRLSGRPAVATSMTMANREHPSVHQSVGWFASKVIVASEPNGLTDVRGYLTAFRTEIVEAINSARVPWPTVIHDVSPELLGTQARTPYLSFNAQPLRMRRGQHIEALHGVALTEVPIVVMWNDAAIANYWREEDDGLYLDVNYKTDWHAEADVAALWDVTVDAVARIAASAEEF